MKTRFEKYLKDGEKSISLVIEKLSEKDLDYVKRNFKSDEPWNSSLKCPKSINILIMGDCITYSLFNNNLKDEYELFKKLKGSFKDKLK